MLIAPSRAPEATWTPVMSAEVLFAPIDRTMLIRARRAAREASQARADAAASTDATPALDMIEELGDVMSRALIMEGVKDWRHVFVQAEQLDGNDEPIFDLLPFSSENLSILLSDPVVFEAFDSAYVVPFMVRERERAEPGNGYAASPSGTGEAVMPASDIATSPAKRTKGSAARSAPTSSKSPEPRRKKTSGGS